MDLKFVDTDTFIVQFILLAVILWVLNKFLFKPYLKYLDEWEDKNKKLENDYNHIDDLIKKANEEKEEILSKARIKWNALISEAENVAKQKRVNLISDAENEASNIIRNSKTDIEKEKLDMLNSIKSRVVDLALKLNSKLFENEKVSRDYLEKNIDSI